MTLDTEKILNFCRHHPKLRNHVDEVLLFDKVHSTNRLALEMGSNGLPGGMVILAESQTDGQGRLGRHWFSPPGRNIYLSMLIRPYVSMRDYPLFSPATAVGVIQGIQSLTGLETGIKWPNDIVIRNKKIGGILLESKPRGEQTTPLVIGIGLNVNIDMASFPPALQASASSLKIETGRSVDRSDLVNAILEGISEQIFRLQEGKKEDMLQVARARSLTLGKQVQVDTPHQVFVGWAEAIEEDGALRLRLGDQSRRSILLGEIKHLREIAESAR